MAEESELVGGISVELRAGSSKLPGDLAAAERLVQQWAKQVATVELRAVGRAPAGGAGAGVSGSGEATNIARAIEQGFANLAVRSGGRSQPTSIPVGFGAGGTVRGGSLQNLPVALQNKISEALGEVEERAVNVTAVVAASARRPRQSTENLAREAVSASELEAIPVTIDTAGLKAQLADVLAAFRAFHAEVVRLAEVPVTAKPGAPVQPVTASSMQVRDAEQAAAAAAARARRATQSEAAAAATAVRDRGIPDTSQEFLEERYTRPLAAQAAVAVPPAPRPAVQPTRLVPPVVSRREEATPQATAETAAPIVVTATRQRARAAVTEDIRYEETQRVASVRRTLGFTKSEYAQLTREQRATAERVVGPASGPAARDVADIRRRRAAAATGGEEGEEGGLTGMTRRAVFAMREEERAGARIQGARSRAGRIAYNESEKQRRTELNATVKHYDSLAVLAERHFDAQASRLGGMEPDEERAGSQQRLQQLSYEAQRESAKAPPTSATFAPQRTPAQIAALREEEARRADAAASAPRPSPPLSPAPRSAARPSPGLTTIAPPARQPVDDVERARRRALAELNDRERAGRGGIGSGATDYRRSVEDIERRQQLRVAQGESQRLTAARTSRTFAAGLGGFSPLGTARQQIEANAGLAASNEKVAVAMKRLDDPAIIRRPRDYRHATEELTVALKERAMWTEKIEKLATGGTALRTLAAVTVAGAAFGLAMQGVSVAMDLAGKAIGPTLERLTGFATTTAAYTDNLADATRAASGNAQAVTALKLASTGLSAETARSIQPLIQQRAEIEAGNKAIREQIEAFHVAENLRGQGKTAGLTSGTGGILGTGILGTPGTSEQLRDFLGQLGQKATIAPSGQPRSLAALEETRRARGIPAPTETTEAQEAFARGVESINAQLDKGGETAIRFAQATSEADARVQATADAFRSLDPVLADVIQKNRLYADNIRNEADAKRALGAYNFAAQLPDPELLQQQFNRTNPALVSAAERQQQWALQVQLPAQQGLQNLAAPLKPVGTGIAAANAEEQRRIGAGQKESIALQDQLNARYEQGVQILQNTYKVPPQLLGQIRAVGAQIAGLQASIANEQAAYQVQLYNNQLFIARRTLSDINALNNQNLLGAGQSYLGRLEKENLALSRQSQLLQFTLAHRRIDFQIAQAGFQAPGETPEQIAANVREAKYEAATAERLLGYQEKMFGNQVQIVDINNLRQGEDLVRKIGELTEGRRITLDVQIKTEEIERLLLIQQQQVAEVGTYIAEVDSFFATANSQIQQLEVAAGRAVAGVAAKVMEEFNLFLTGVNNSLDNMFGVYDPNNPNTRNGGGYGQMGQPGQPRNSNGGGFGESRLPAYGGVSPQEEHRRGEREFAAGVLGRATGRTDITVGDAGGEEVAILRNPRAYLGGESGGVNVTINFSGVSVRSENDIDTIVHKVTEAMNSRAGLLLRTG